MSDFDNISVAKEHTLAFLTVKRPEALNALNEATLVEIGAALEEMRYIHSSTATHCRRKSEHRFVS
jgi:enoyl-CoA hydratase/carnithine racemase